MCQQHPHRAQSQRLLAQGVTCSRVSGLKPAYSIISDFTVFVHLSCTQFWLLIIKRNRLQRWAWIFRLSSNRPRNEIGATYSPDSIGKPTHPTLSAIFFKTGCVAQGVYPLCWPRGINKYIPVALARVVACNPPRYHDFAHWAAGLGYFPRPNRFATCYGDAALP